MGEDIRANANTKKIIKIIFKLIYQLLIIFCFILAAIIALQKVTNGNKSVAGYRIFRVITGSMEPEYDVGEVVISKEVDPRKIKVGDAIIYMGRYGEYSGKIIMHSVIGIEEDSNGNLNFHAKGLHSSSVEDPQIKQEQIFGVVKYKSKLLTILYKAASNIYSLFVIIIVLVLNVFIAFRTNKKPKIQKLGEAVNEYEEDNEEFEDEDIEESEEDTDELTEEDESEDESEDEDQEE